MNLADEVVRQQFGEFQSTFDDFGGQAEAHLVADRLLDSYTSERDGSSPSNSRAAGVSASASSGSSGVSPWPGSRDVTPSDVPRGTRPLCPNARDRQEQHDARAQRWPASIVRPHDAARQD